MIKLINLQRDAYAWDFGKKIVLSEKTDDHHINQVVEISEKLQDEFHQLAKELTKTNEKLEYQDAFATWLYMRLASMMIELNDLNYKLSKLKR